MGTPIAMPTLVKLKRKGECRPNWQVRFKGANGRFMHRMTPFPLDGGKSSERKALKMGLELEKEQSKARESNSDKIAEIRAIRDEEAREMEKGEYNKKRALFYENKISEVWMGEETKSPSLSNYLKDFLVWKELHVRSATLTRYKEFYRCVVRVMGDIADKPINHLLLDDLEDIQLALVNEDIPKKSNITINKKMNFIRMALKRAYKKQLIQYNIGEGVEPLPEEPKIYVDFTKEEIEKLLEVGTWDQKGFILFGLKTGLRMSDICSLKWEMIDIQKRELKLFTNKWHLQSKKKRVKKKYYLGNELFRYLHQTGLKKEGSVMPTLDTYLKDWQSKSFKNLMEKAGVPRFGSGLGDVEGLRSAHSLKHTYNTWADASGVSSDVMMYNSNHSSKDVNNIYIHPNWMDKLKRGDEEIIDHIGELKWG